MENNLKVFKSDKFDVEDTASLSLFLYPHSLFVFAKDQNQATTCIHHYANFEWEKLEGLLSSEPLLRSDVPVKVYLHQGIFSLVPGVLFSAGKEQEYLKFAGPITDDVEYYSSGLDSNNLQVISCIRKKLKKSLEARYSEVMLHHGSCSFLSYLFKERFNLIGQEILINYFGDHMYLAAFTDQDLSVFNFFEIEGKEDLLKYTLITLDLLKYDRNHVRISVFGASEKSGITEDWGKSYFQNFRIITPHANQSYTHGFKHLKSLHVLEASWQYE